MRLVLAILLLTCFAANGQRQSFYISSSTGNDNNTGADAAHAWKTWKNESSLPIACNVYFKAGDTFPKFAPQRASTDTVHFADSIVLDSYGTGAKPIITPMAEISNWKASAKWHRLDSFPNVWGMPLDSLVHRTPRMWINGVEYKRAKDSSYVDATHRTSWVDYTDFTHNYYGPEYLYVYSATNPATTFNSFRSASFAQYGLKIVITNVKILNLDIRGAGGDNGSALDLGGTKWTRIQYCTIGIDGSREGIRTNRDTLLTIRNNDINTGETNLQNFNNPIEGGDGISITQASDQVDASYNNVTNWRHGGIIIEQGNTSDTLSNVTVSYNDVSNSLDYGRATACYWNAGKNITIAHNDFHDCPVQSQFAAKNVQVLYNNFRRTRNVVYDEIYDPRLDAGTGFAINIGHGTYEPQNMTFRGNFITDNHTGGIYINGNLLNNGADKDAFGNVFDSNYLANNGFDVKEPIQSIGPTYYPLNTSIFVADNLDVLGNTYTHNVFNDSLTLTPIFFRGSYKTVAQFNATTSAQGDVIALNSIYTPVIIPTLPQDDRIIIKRKVITTTGIGNQ